MNEGSISRRRFVRCGMAGGVALLMGAAPATQRARPLFRFVQINDLHVQSDDPPVQSPAEKTYARANEKARWLVDAINREKLSPLPDFVVGVGDLIHGGSVDRLGPDTQALMGILKPLRCPFYPVVGNHEVVQMERSPAHLRAYIDAFGRERMEYTFTHQGVLFIALNNSGAPSPVAAKVRNGWLSGVLKENRDRPKIILCHIPLIPLREPATLAKSFGFSSYCDQDPGTLKLVDEYSDTVIAVLSGHLHLTGMKMRKEVCHLSLSGTTSYPADGLALFEVFPERIDVAVQRLPEELARSAASIHGKPRHAQDFTDSLHGSAEEYQRGADGERRFSIPLNAGGSS